jgi:Ca2+-binding RTX toxin-like protein
MPQIRIEWVPVHTFGLGLFGFDHLHLVFQQDGGEIGHSQDAWYVLEGVREADGTKAFLGIEGADGRTSLAAANLAARDDLVVKIGTPDYRGSRPLPFDGNELQAWETMASVARDIERQDFPYVAYAPPGSPMPTINSSSAVASLVHYSGFDPSSQLPFGMRMSPGTTTLLGTGGDDAMRIEHGFTTLLGGDGRDAFFGGAAPGAIEKFYGGGDDDLFHWSSGFNIIHGGQPQLGYEADGTDVIDYSGAGTVTITFNRHWVPHKVPHYVAAFETGFDHLYSVERIQWNEASDRIVLRKGVALFEDNVILKPHAGLSGQDETPADAANVRGGRMLVTDTHHNLLQGDGAANVLNGTPGDDTFDGGAGYDTFVGGAGSDGYVYLPGDGDDVVIDDGPATDMDELILAGGIDPAAVSLLRPAADPADLVLSFAGGGSIRIADFFAAPASGIERVVFDRAPAWSRKDLKQLAGAAPLLDDDVLVFRPELVDTEATAASDSIAAAADPVPDPAAASYAHADASLIHIPIMGGFGGHEGWLF